jgi:hypothetical protein
MPFSNYTELKAALGGADGWLHRSNLTAQIPDFIALAESRINRLARVRTMEIEAPLVMTVNSRVIALPAGFSVPLAVWLESVQPRQQLTAVVPESLSVTTAPGMPHFWAIDGDNLAFERPADSAYPVTLRYSGNFTLSDAAPTNAVLTNYPDLYLHGAQLAAALYTRNPDQATLCKQLFDEAVREMNQNESRVRAAAPLRTELAHMVGCRSSGIYRGY